MAGLAVAVMVVPVLGVGEASAARYAKPSGGATAGDCTTPETACTLERAASLCFMDEIVARAGVYTLAQTLKVENCHFVRDPGDVGKVVLQSTGPGEVLLIGPFNDSIKDVLRDVQVRGDLRSQAGGFSVYDGVVVEGNLVSPSGDFCCYHLEIVGGGLDVAGNWGVEGRTVYVTATAPVRVGGALRIDVTDTTTVTLTDGHVGELVQNGRLVEFRPGTFVIDKPLVVTGAGVIQRGTLKVPSVEVQPSAGYRLFGPLEGDLHVSGPMLVDAASTRTGEVRGNLDLRAGGTLLLGGIKAGATLADPVLPVQGTATLAGAVELSGSEDEQSLAPFQRVVAVRADSLTGQVTVSDAGDYAPLRRAPALVLTRGPELEEPLAATRDGDLVTVPLGRWVAKPVAQVTRRWQRCDGDACTDIPGATGETYRVTDADRGHALQAVETAVSDDRSAGAASPRVDVAPLPPPGECANGVDDDDDGFVDLRDPQCAAHHPKEGPKDDPLLACAQLEVLLTDVLPERGGRVRFAGLADPTKAGQAVVIRTGRRRVATTRVLPGGRFAVTARARGVRFTATIGTVTSRALKLQRHTLDARVVRRGGRVGLSAHVTTVRRKGAVVELLARETACGAYRVVTTMKLPRSGRFTILAPAGVHARVLRARVRLRHGGKTFSLPRSVG